MKTIPTASPAPASAAASATAIPTSVTRPATSAPRPAAGTVDYRANVERQSREQKSVGNILSYIVYGFIGISLIAAGLAGYGGYTLSRQIHDQSVTVSDLDARYAAANKDLLTKLAATQDTLTQAQAQITRQQDLILKQQDALNRLATSANSTAYDLKKEAQARAQETANLRARVRDLDERISQAKF